MVPSTIISIIYTTSEKGFKKICWVETDLNRFGSHQNHENLTLYEGTPPQGLSEARRGGSFF